MKKVTGSIFCTSTWKFISSFGICFCSTCSAVGLRGFCQHGQGTTSPPRWPVPPPLQFPPGHGDGQEKNQGVFPAGMGLERLCVWGMHDLPPTRSQSIPHTLGFEMKPLHLSAVIMGFLQTPFYIALHHLYQNQSRKNSPWPILFFLFYDSVWISKRFRIRQGEKKKVLAAFI